jgi:hypothetical protein
MLEWILKIMQSIFYILLQQHNITLYHEHAIFAKEDHRPKQRRTHYFRSVIKCSWYYKHSKEACSPHWQNADNGIQRYDNGTYLATIYPTIYKWITGELAYHSSFLITNKWQNQITQLDNSSTNSSMIVRSAAVSRANLTAYDGSN